MLVKVHFEAKHISHTNFPHAHTQPSLIPLTLVANSKEKQLSQDALFHPRVQIAKILMPSQFLSFSLNTLGETQWQIHQHVAVSI